MNHIEISPITSFEDIKEKSLSAANHKKFKIYNKNYVSLRELAGEGIVGGKEVGSSAYIGKSPYFFIRTKACQPENYLLDFKKGTVLPINPYEFINQDIKKGDILILKDSNIGEVIYVDEDLNNYMLSGGFRKLRLPYDSLYIFAFLKSPLYKEQLDIMIGKGATIKHAQDKYLDGIVFFPKRKAEEVKIFITDLVKAVIRKEREIKKKDKKILTMFGNEIKENSRKLRYTTSFNDIKNAERIDSGFLSEEFQMQIEMMKNFKLGSKTIYDLGFTIERGQNLQISAIGNSIYSEELKDNYYKLFLPTNITEVGTMSNIIYLGNINKLKCLEYGDLIIGAEGFEKGRSIVITEPISNTITNIHGIILKSMDKDLNKSIYLRCFLHYMRYQGMIDRYGAGGNGGSLAIKYWDNIYIPLLKEEQQKSICSLYYNNIDFDIINSLDNFTQIDKQITEESGILNLDKQIKLLKGKINELIFRIYHDDDVDLNFDFLLN